VHRYRVEHRSPREGFGALHTIDVPLVFGSFDDDAVAAEMSGADDAARATSSALQQVVRAFVHGDELDWPPLPADGGSQALAVFGGDSPVRHASEAQPRLRS
jgi:carboxylesterase type B